MGRFLHFFDFKVSVTLREIYTNKKPCFPNEKEETLIK